MADVPTHDARSLALVRHGATAANESGRLLSRGDPGLSSLGWAQCNHLRDQWLDRLSGWPVLTSPTLRARETAVGMFGAGVATSHLDLRERDVGQYEGMTAGELEVARARVGVDSLDMTLVWDSVPGVEQDGAIVGRTSRVIAEATESTPILPGGGVVVVTHAGVIKALLHAMLDVPPGRPYGFRVGLGSVAVLVSHRHHWELSEFWQNPDSRPRFLD